jgi:hypothetical protein
MVVGDLLIAVVRRQRQVALGDRKLLAQEGADRRVALRRRRGRWRTKQLGAGRLRKKL